MARLYGNGNPMKVLAVFGTRPEAIKLAPVIRQLKADPRFEVIGASTGQHREILHAVTERFGIHPDFDLGLMESGQSLSSFLARCVTGLDRVLAEVQPQAVIVQGDTTSALAGAIAGFHRKVDIAHLEAGLRTGDLYSPFPEEGNRKMISQVSQLHLAPTPSAKQNLIGEGVPGGRIVITGNTVIDALDIAAGWEVEFADSRISKAVESERPIILVTSHRRENLGEMDGIGRAIRAVATRYPDFQLVLPLHPNPMVRNPIESEVKGVENILVTAPLPYDQFTGLMKSAALILTDSGGIQEEAPALGVPVLVMRSNTERPEALEAGTVKLIGSDCAGIVSEVSHLLDNQESYRKMVHAVNPYGDGLAAARTVAALAQLGGVGERLPDFSPSIGTRSGLGA